MEPISATLGAIVATLVAKTGDRAAEKVVDGAVGGAREIVGRVHDRFARDGDEVGTTVLARLMDAPDSPSRASELAAVVDDRAGRDPGFAEELWRLVKAAEDAGVVVGPIAQHAVGTGNVQTAGLVNSQVTVTQSPPPITPSGD